MAKKPVFAAFGLIIASYLALNSLVLPAIGAQEDLNSPPQSVGLLPTNPFYFIKEWSRGVRRALTFDAVKKANWELDVLQSKLGELKKLESINPDNVTGLNIAAKRYLQGLKSLIGRLQYLRGISQNAELEKFLDKLADRILFHQLIFDGLEIVFANSEELSESIALIKKSLADLVGVIVSQIESAAEFSSRLQLAIERLTPKFSGLAIIEAIDAWEQELSSQDRQELLQLKEELLLDFTGRLEAIALVSGVQGLPDLVGLAGDPLRRLAVLDEVRELVLNPDLKSQLNVVRQRFLSQSQIISSLDLKTVEEAIAFAEALVQELEKFISDTEGGVPNSVKQILERSKFNLSQAKALLEKENYGNAFGQAIAASAAAKNGLSQVSASLDELHSELKTLASRYDQLFRKAGDFNLTKDNSPELFKLFIEAEKRIAETSRLINAGAGADRLAVPIRTIKLLLATINALIYNPSQ